MSRPVRAEQFWGAHPTLVGAVLFPSLSVCVPQVCCPCAAAFQRGTGPPGRPPAPCSLLASRSPRVVPSATTRSRWSWTRAQVRRVAPLRCHPQPMGIVGHRQAPFHPCRMSCVALGVESHQSPRCSSCSCLGPSERSVWGWELHRLWALQVVGATGKPLPVHCPFCGGAWFGHLVEWQCSIREELLGISVTWLPGIAAMGPCPCTEQRCLCLWLPRCSFQAPGCVLVLFEAGHGCSTQAKHSGGTFRVV